MGILHPAKQAIGLATLILIWAAPLAAQPFGLLPGQPQKTATRPALAVPQGRFVFGQISESSKDQFMLDTHTGRLWRIRENSRLGLHLKAVPYCNSKGECSPIPGPVESE